MNKILALHTEKHRIFSPRKIKLKTESCFCDILQDISTASASVYNDNR